METFIATLTTGVSVNGSPVTSHNFLSKISAIVGSKSSGKLYTTKSSFETQEEWLFTAFNNLALNAFQAVLQQSKDIQRENYELMEKYEKLKSKCTLLTSEVKDLSQKLEKSASQRSQEESKLKIKYQDLEEKMKKCASIINSTFMDGGVMGQVRDIITQSIPDEVPTVECTLMPVKQAEKQSGRLKKNSVSHHAVTISKQPVLCVDDDEETSILAPSSPDHSYSDEEPTGNIKVIPETVPFDFTPIKRETKRQSLFKNPRCVLNPIQKSRCPISPKKLVSPAKRMATPKKSPFNCENSQDFVTYSPPIVADFGSPIAPKFTPTPSKLKKESNTSRNDKTNNQDRALPASKQQVFVTTPSKKTKTLKQSKLTVTSNRSTSQTTGTRTATKAVRVSPCKQESKRRRKGKDPEDWECKECYRLFREAELANKIDVRKMPVSMNFCSEHRNRYTYYLNTPPGFWDCGIGRSPRNGHLHPLDASAADDDEDFVQ